MHLPGFVAERAHDRPALITAHAGNRHPAAGQAGLQRFLQLPALGIEKCVADLVRGEGDARDDLTRLGPQ